MPNPEKTRLQSVACLGLALVLPVLTGLIAVTNLLAGVTAGEWLLVFGGLAAGVALWFGLKRLRGLTERLPPVCLWALPLVLTLVTRAVWLLSTRVEPQLDFNRFYRTALALAEGRTFASAPYQAVFPHLMGWPLLLSMIFRVLGGSVFVAQGVNVALSLGITALIYALLARMTSRHTAFWGALLYALLPGPVYHSSLIATELPHLFFVLLCLLLFWDTVHLPGPQRAWQPLLCWGLLGLGVALSSMIRPVGPIFLLGFALWFWVFRPSPFRFRWTGQRLEKLLPPLCMLLVYCVAMQGVYALADGVYGVPVARGGIGWNLYVGLNTQSRGGWNEADSVILNERLEAGLSAQEIQDAFFDDAMTRLRALSPTDALRLGAQKLNAVWARDGMSWYWVRTGQADYSPTNFAAANRLGLSAEKASWGLLLGLALTSVLLALRRGRTAYTLPMALVTGLILAFLLLEANPRYKFPALALLTLCLDWTAPVPESAGAPELSGEGGPGHAE